jgi:hypothetical protein
LFSISNDITRPKPPTNSFPFGTSIFCGASCFVSVVLVAVGDDDVVADDDASCFGAAIDGVSTVICICISTGATGGTSIGAGTGTSIVLIGLIGLTGLFTFIGLLVVI